VRGNHVFLRIQTYRGTSIWGQEHVQSGRTGQPIGRGQGAGVTVPVRGPLINTQGCWRAARRCVLREKASAATAAAVPPPAAYSAAWALLVLPRLPCPPLPLALLLLPSPLQGLLQGRSPPGAAPRQQVHDVLPQPPSLLGWFITRRTLALRGSASSCCISVRAIHQFAKRCCLQNLTRAPPPPRPTLTHLDAGGPPVDEVGGLALPYALQALVHLEGVDV
jgi:hypothetical protein